MERRLTKTVGRSTDLQLRLAKVVFRTKAYAMMLKAVDAPITFDGITV